MSLDEEDMRLMRENLKLLDRYSTEERLMWVWCANTGMRPKEVYHIQEEFTEIVAAKHPIRYIWIQRSKSEASTRKLPIPEPVLELLPRKIQGPLFRQKLYNLLIHMNDTMRRVGISNPDPETGVERKVVYSLRHRAKDRLQHGRCPEDIGKAILGHVKSEHDRYGQGFPMWQIKPWIEVIGW
jgi:integrase